MNLNIDASGIGCGVGVPDENLAVTFNLLKNKINTIGGYFKSKNDLTITDPVPTPRAPLCINTNTPTKNKPNNLDKQKNQLHHEFELQEEEPEQPEQRKYSTPLSSLGKTTSLASSNTASASTPISIIRENFNTIPELMITEEGYTESTAGSDLGSVMDLDDFEKSL
jgi:hypothetical protein